jgi:hypothetical protein
MKSLIIRETVLPKNHTDLYKYKEIRRSVR